VGAFFEHLQANPDIPLLMFQEVAAGGHAPPPSCASSEWRAPRLEEAGAVLVARDYEIGHWIAPEEIEDAMRFVEGKGEDRRES